MYGSCMSSVRPTLAHQSYETSRYMSKYEQIWVLHTYFCLHCRYNSFPCRYNQITQPNTQLLSRLCKNQLKQICTSCVHCYKYTDTYVYTHTIVHAHIYLHTDTHVYTHTIVHAHIYSVNSYWLYGQLQLRLLVPHSHKLVLDCDL